MPLNISRHNVRPKCAFLDPFSQKFAEVEDVGGYPDLIFEEISIGYFLTIKMKTFQKYFWPSQCHMAEMCILINF